MTRDRSAATLIVFAALLASPPSGASAATPAAPRLSTAPPAWLSAGARSHTTATALPHTGDDLLAEVLVASGLLAAGAIVRARRA